MDKIEGMTDTELLACILAGSSNPSTATLGKGKRLDARTSCDYRLIEEAIDGLPCTEREAFRMRLALEFARRIGKSVLRTGAILTTSSQVYEYYLPLLRGEKQERFYVVGLDSQRRVVYDDLVSKGTLDSTIVHPRDVFSLAIKRGVSAIICIHNHPSGDPKPSEQDNDMTRRLCDAGKLLGIEILDHVIVGANTYYSYLESKALQKPCEQGIFALPSLKKLLGEKG